MGDPTEGCGCALATNQKAFPGSTTTTTVHRQLTEVPTIASAKLAVLQKVRAYGVSHKPLSIQEPWVLRRGHAR